MAESNDNSARIWQFIALIACIAAVLIATVSNRDKAMLVVPKTQEKFPKDFPAMASEKCPEIPPILPLPSPLPKRIVDVLSTIENHVSSMAKAAENKSAISMNIIYRDSVIWSGHYGSKTFKGTVPPDDETVYRIGSLTKVFPVLLLYKLVEDGLITSIDDPLNKYAPNFHINNPFTGSNITLRQIASQLAGLPREGPCQFQCSDTTSAKELEQMKDDDLVVAPWTTPVYSNLGYALLGRLLTENLLDTTFEEWVHKEVLAPLGMKNTGFIITDQVKEKMALPYTPTGEVRPFMKLGWLAPAGEMYSTLADLVKLGRMFTNPKAPSMLKRETLRDMMLVDFVTRDGITLWGSVLEMRVVDGFVVRAKAGNLDTYATQFAIVPELQLGINIIVNMDIAFPTQQLTSILLSDYVHRNFIPALTETLFDLQQQANFPIDPTPFLGTYNVTQFISFMEVTLNYIATISTDKDKLVLTSQTNPMAGLTITYMGQPLMFQARMTMMNAGICYLYHGTAGDAVMKFAPPGEDGLSEEFFASASQTRGYRIRD